MKETIDGILNLIEALILGGAIALGGSYTLEFVHKQVKAAAFEALKRPTPSLEKFTKRLIQPDPTKNKSNQYERN